MAVVDGVGCFAAPGSVLIELGAEPGHDGWRVHVLAAGRSADVRRHAASGAAATRVVSRARSVLIPGLVNAHAHLDLTHLGPREHDPDKGFMAWIDMIRAGRHEGDEAIAGSVAKGVGLSLAAGTVAIGDIGGAPRGRPSLAAWRALRASGMRGVSFLEFFGVGRTAVRSRAALAEALRVAGEEAGPPGAMLGLQPHAPNTVATWLYREAVGLAREGLSDRGAGRGREGRPLPMSTHLAESPEERAFVAEARGPQREFLERLGLWDDSVLEDVGHGRTPVQHLAPVLAGRPMLLAHVNDADDGAIQTLAGTGSSVVYCPHASAYFGAERHFGPHRYREMLAAGINVALGTDSIVNLPAGSERLPSPSTLLSQASGLSILREMRLLMERDGAEPVMLLRMATVNGGPALELDAAAFAFAGGGPLAGLLAVEVPDGGAGGGPSEAVAAALRATHGPEILFADNYSGLIGTLVID